MNVNLANWIYNDVPKRQIDRPFNSKKQIYNSLLKIIFFFIQILNVCELFFD